MKYQYLLFNLVVIAGPVFSSFERRVHYVSRWPAALLAAAVVMIPYVIWDAWAVNVHWSFNEKYTLGICVAGLPIEEWLFFITIPFVSIFVWECICAYAGNRKMERLSLVRIILISGIPIGIWILPTGKQYTALVLMALGLAALLDSLLRTHLLLQPRAYLYLAIITVFILVFNGYLASRPVVVYNARYQVGLRVGSIPIEDFPYGYSLILLATILYEKTKGRRRG